mmetsp:Transcript_27238/g.54451  ORF Transcript_27238/g.54451 Transcript_27238/m.54451 type:complete len:318 (+) Transcript_27238:102-1055(+)
MIITIASIFNAISIVLIFISTSKNACAFSQRPSILRSARQCSQSMQTISVAEGGAAVSSSFVVALTREEGKNDKLRRALTSSENISKSVQVLEIPCIVHANGPDSERLVPTLSSTQFDYIAITSPEAAKVLANAWNEAGRPKLGMIVAVGKATQDTLVQNGIEVAFVPSKATAETLVKELPHSDAAIGEGRKTTLFYPASAKAKKTLQTGLEERGFDVLRLNTYDTVPATWDAHQLSLAEKATVACFASPSAVNAWMKNSSEIDKPRALAACIGETSAEACRSNEWDEGDIFYPENPGVDGWVMAVAEALEKLSLRN